MTLFGKIFENVILKKQFQDKIILNLGWTLNPRMGVFIRREEGRYTKTQKKESHGNVGAEKSHSERVREIPRARIGKGAFSPRSLEGV